MSELVSLDTLLQELTREARSPGHAVLYCAQDVSNVLSAALPPTPSSPLSPCDFFTAGVIADLLAVDIVVTPDSAPGTFRLVRHYDGHAITCEVHGETVSHARCPVILEGTLTSKEQE